MLEMENVSQPTGIVLLHHVERVLSSMREKVFILTNVVMEKDQDIIKRYEVILIKAIRYLVCILSCELKCLKEERESLSPLL